MSVDGGIPLEQGGQTQEQRETTSIGKINLSSYNKEIFEKKTGGSETAELVEDLLKRLAQEDMLAIEERASKEAVNFKGGRDMALSQALENYSVGLNWGVHQAVASDLSLETIYQGYFRNIQQDPENKKLAREAAMPVLKGYLSAAIMSGIAAQALQALYHISGEDRQKFEGYLPLLSELRKKYPERVNCLFGERGTGSVGNLDYCMENSLNYGWDANEGKYTYRVQQGGSNRAFIWK